MKKKFLIVKLSSMGDVIHTLPVPHLIKDEYPDSKIHWIVEDLSKDLVAANPFVDEVIIFPKNKWHDKFKNNKLETLWEVKNYFHYLRSYNYNYALDFQSLFKSAIITYFSGASKRIGFSNGRELSPLFYNVKIDQKNRTHVINRYLKLLDFFNIDIDKKKLSFDIDISKKTKNEIHKIFKRFNLYDKNFIILHPFTSWSTKNWSLIKYKQLALKIISNFNSKIVLTGSQKDKIKINKIMPNDKRIINLAGELNLLELTYLYQKSSIFIGGDTGPMHLAAAQNISIVAIMGPTDPNRNGPFCDNKVVIQKDIECKNCWKNVCSNDNICMKKIEVEEVFRAVKKLWSDL